MRRKRIKKKGKNEMKKVFPLLLAAVMLASVLASCASVSPANVSSNIRVTSSDAIDAAAWLTERLGERLTDSVVIGTNADDYDVNVDALEDDGFFIRSFGREDVLFAKTPEGLDRAVRKYAKAVEAGKAVEETAYHEGYRVERLTVAGNDISEYAIVRVTEDDPCVGTAASELAEYIEKTCGASLPVFAASEYKAAADKPARRIEITSGDKTLGDEGFTITVDEAGDLHIDGGVWRGALWGVYDLLEDDIGWRFLAGTSYYEIIVPADRREYLYEAEHIDITSAANRTEIPSIPIRGGCDGLKQRNTYHTQGQEKYGGYGFTIRACHGLQNNHDLIFSGDYAGVYLGLSESGFIQPCFTDEDVLEAIDHYALEYVRSRREAGQKIGKEIIAVDVAHWDGGLWTFCKCRNCEKMLSIEGYHSGAVLRMANRVADLLNEKYTGVCSMILAYGPTDTLPRVTRPRDNVIISFCFYSSDYYCSANCSNHCISGVDCDRAKGGVTNYYAAKCFEEWMTVVAPERMQIWYYPYMTANKCYNSPVYTVLLDDMRYLASFGVEHIYYCMDRTLGNSNGMLIEGLNEYLGSRYMWDAYMSEEEALGYLREWFTIIYGEEAGGELYELTMFAERAGDLAGCWSAYGDKEPGQLDRVSYDYVAKHADEVWEKCLRAAYLADDAASEELAERYATGFMFMIVRALYDDMYVNGTPDEKALITERYREMWERMAKYELFPFEKYGVPETFDPNFDPRKWLKIPPIG